MVDVLRCPSTKTIRRLRNHIINRSFHERHQGQRNKCRIDEIIELLNKIETCPSIPEQIRLHAMTRYVV